MPRFTAARLTGVLLSLVAASSPINADQQPDQQWPHHGNNQAETRYAQASQINTETIGQLGLAWHFRFDRPRGVEATPIMVGDTLYVSGPWGLVYALDARTGELRWQHDPQVEPGKGAVSCCDVVNRGVAVADGKVFVGTLDGRLQALDATSGALLWETLTVDPQQPYSITGAPASPMVW